MRFNHFTFGAIDIDGVTYEHDLVIDRGEIHRRKKSSGYSSCSSPKAVVSENMARQVT
jgi:hypothetical protein